jgi:hypothetical protein
MQTFATRRSKHTFMPSFVVDFIAKGTADDEWRMVLVEAGPWHSSETRLQSIQDRLYNCIDAAIDGQLAEQFPQTLGKRIVIELDCYDSPEAEIIEFFDRFSGGVLALDEYRSALSNNPYVREIGFNLNLGASD